MKFKHTILVLIDNFSLTYKLLLYRFIVTVVAMGLFTAIISPFIRALTGSPDFTSLIEGLRNFLANLANGEVPELAEASEQIKNAFSALVSLVKNNLKIISVGFLGLALVWLVQNFFLTLGNFAAAAVVNDKMALRAKSPFFLTLVRHLKEATVYSLFYVALSFFYDLTCLIIMYFFVFKLLNLLPFVNPVTEIFIFATFIVFLISIKMTFASDWLPTLIRGRKKQGEAFLYTFSRKNKDTFNVLSTFVVLVLIVFAVNVFAALFTFGVASLITIPASYILFIAYQFVNYYDREELKYFVDKNTIIKPEKETPLTREEFFRGKQ